MIVLHKRWVVALSAVDTSHQTPSALSLNTEPNPFSAEIVVTPLLIIIVPHNIERTIVIAV